MAILAIFSRNIQQINMMKILLKNPDNQTPYQLALYVDIAEKMQQLTTIQLILKLKHRKNIFFFKILKCIEQWAIICNKYQMSANGQNKNVVRAVTHYIT